MLAFSFGLLRITVNVLVVIRDIEIEDLLEQIGSLHARLGSHARILAISIAIGLVVSFLLVHADINNIHTITRTTLLEL